MIDLGLVIYSYYADFEGVGRDIAIFDLLAVKAEELPQSGVSDSEDGFSLLGTRD